MDYEYIDQLLLSKRLANNPAFSDVNIAIKPTPDLNGCPLGLYYPDGPPPTVLNEAGFQLDEPTIILPPDATDGALLHELGHRHGHFYYDDLSEMYAENFREKYQKGRALLYAGGDFARMPKFGTLFKEGQKGMVEMALAHPLTLDELHELKNQLYSNGRTDEVLPKMYYGGGEAPWVRVEFTKGVDWMVIVGSTLAATLVAGVGAIGYAVYKTAETTPWVVPLALAGMGAFLLLLPALKRARARA